MRGLVYQMPLAQFAIIILQLILIDAEIIRRGVFRHFIFDGTSLDRSRHTGHHSHFYNLLHSQHPVLRVRCLGIQHHHNGL